MTLIQSLHYALSFIPVSRHWSFTGLSDGNPNQLLVKAFLSFTVLLVSFYVIPLLRDILFSPLRKVPGPFWARVSRWWEYRCVATGTSNLEYIRLHQKHGHVVRVGPNRYSISQPEAIKAIYELGGKFTKTDYYAPLLDPIPDQQNIFPMQDNTLHKERRRKISPLYTMSAMVSYERAVDKMTEVCIQKLHQFSEERRLVDIPHFMQYYAFDVIGEITFNRSFGMMQHEGDTTGMIRGIREALDLLGYIGVVPDLLPWILALKAILRQKSNASQLADYSLVQINKHRNSNRDSTKIEKSYDTFLKKVLDLEAQGRIGMPNIMDCCGGNIGAGSDTTAITLSAVLFYLFTNPEKLATLRQEIDTHAAEGRISDPVTFQEAAGMPYLQAVIKETLRVHPAVGTILARKVPKGGMQASGYYFPEGTEVGANAWVLHYSQDIYGPDPEKFRPERWMGNEKTSLMDSMMFAFGAGSRTCIGRNISLLEMTKVVPQIVRKFDIKLEHPDQPMDTTCAWFVYPHYNGWFQVRDPK